MGKKITIFDPEKSVLYTLNETAATIFRLLNQGFDGEDIVKKFSKKFKISEVTARKDLLLCLKDLRYKKILLYINFDIDNQN